jgi:hypothetical protein
MPVAGNGPFARCNPPESVHGADLTLLISMTLIPQRPREFWKP